MSTQRVLKFRAFDKKEGKWICGYEYGNLGGFSLFGEVILMGEWESVVGRFIVNQKDRTPDDLVVMQFTGLKDKNGKEVYEGDVIDFTGCDPCEDGSWLRTIVHWNAKDCQFDYGPVSFWIGHVAYDGEVVGNIHENPELLNS